MRIILFEDNPPRLYKEMNVLQFDSRLWPIDMYVYIPEMPNHNHKWYMRRFGAGRAGNMPFDVLTENQIPKEILAMALLLE